MAHRLEKYNVQPHSFSPFIKVGLTSTQSGQLGSQSYLSLMFAFVTCMDSNIFGWWIEYCVGNDNIENCRGEKNDNQVS